jgi:NAD-dependent dihydropyrimidine dehydrogenase PreA subunit
MPVSEIPALTAFLKVETGCIACEWCRFNCPVEDCFTFESQTAIFHPEGCIECSHCIFVCPVDVIIPLRPPNPGRLAKTSLENASQS